MDKNNIKLPQNVTANVQTDQLEKMIDVSLVLEPLWENALGAGWKEIITRDKIKELFLKM